MKNVYNINNKKHWNVNSGLAGQDNALKSMNK